MFAHSSSFLYPWRQGFAFNRPLVKATVVRFPAGARCCSRLQTFQNASGAYPVSDSVCTVESFSPGVKLLVREGNRLPPYSAEVENEWPVLLLGHMLSWYAQEQVCTVIVTARSTWGLLSCGMLRSVDGQSVTEVSGRSVTLILRGQGSVLGLLDPWRWDP
jgi:hypothetical protein